MERHLHPMNANRPKFLEDEAFKCLRSGDFVGFNAAMETRDSIDLSNADLRGTDLRGANLSKVILNGCYFRDADLRGLDLRDHDLDGCSLFHAKISGTWFPYNIDTNEIRLSLEQGTRLRVKK